jgi:hypothetical protein
MSQTLGLIAGDDLCSRQNKAWHIQALVRTVGFYELLYTSADLCLQKVNVVVVEKYEGNV